MKITKFQTPLFFLLALSCPGNLQAYEIQIETGPATDAGPNTFPTENPPGEGETLMSWLEGEIEIARILIGTPYMNSNQVEFTEEYVQDRFENSICVNSRMDEWHYAPLTMGTVYFTNGDRINFIMYLSGISISGNLFE
ncbi:MAG: hypothetical protein K8S15_01010 [Candidatus Aegiribacteria sp.]|nr:hypothetical protein [Candidatus Aegiribacteria sp.]